MWCNNLFDQEWTSIFAGAVDLFVSSAGSGLARFFSGRLNNIIRVAIIQLAQQNVIFPKTSWIGLPFELRHLSQPIKRCQTSSVWS